MRKKETPEIIRPKIYSPITYLELSPEEKKEIWNGCGAKDGLKVPDTFWKWDATIQNISNITPGLSRALTEFEYILKLVKADLIKILSQTKK